MSEPKRYWTSYVCGSVHEVIGDTNTKAVAVYLASDHERVVEEKDSEIAKLSKALDMKLTLISSEALGAAEARAAAAEHQSRCNAQVADDRLNAMRDLNDQRIAAEAECARMREALEAMRFGCALAEAQRDDEIREHGRLRTAAASLIGELEETGEFCVHQSSADVKELLDSAVLAASRGGAGEGS